MATQLEEAIKERLPTRRLDRVRSSSGSALSKTSCYCVDEEKEIFVKTNHNSEASKIFHGEYKSLEAIIATHTVTVPKPHLVLNDFDDKGGSAIIMDYIDIQSITENTARSLGLQLAELHSYNEKLIKYSEKASKWIGKVPPSSKCLKKVEDSESDGSDDESIKFSKHQMRVKSDGMSTSRTMRQDNEFTERFEPMPNTEPVTEFGFNVPTACGVILQINEWTEDWISFYARHRLEHQINLILAEHGDRDLIEKWSHLQLKVDKFFTDFDKQIEERITPSLLHGDMWSGNVAETIDKSTSEKIPVLYDPSSFYGHSEFDFAIARMFGGIPPAMEKSYFQCMTKKKLFEKRNNLYQLFHHLNHWNHFGYGYRSSSLKIMTDLNSSV